MRILGTKKRFAAVATTTAAVLLGSGIAVAFWTTGGDGTGSAEIGTSQDVEYSIEADAIADLYPGATHAFDIQVNNPTAGELYVETITTTVAISNDSPAGDCDAEDFVVDAIDVDADVPAGQSTIAASITMLNTTENQDACKNADVTLTFTS